MNALALTLHVLAAVIWVGGMFLAYTAVRPAAAGLGPPIRLGLWLGIFHRFFPWVWAAVIALPASGYWLIFNLHGGFATLPVHLHVMHGVGWLMFLLYGHLYFGPWQKLKRFIGEEDWEVAGQQLNRIRRIVLINLLLGIALVIIGAGGRYLG